MIRAGNRAKHRSAALPLLSVAVALTIGSVPVLAQKLPPTSGTAFKCEVNGKVTYSDAPCLGGTKVDTTPTRGVNKSSGRERIGADVRHEIQSEQIAEAARSLTGDSKEQWAKRVHRIKLEPAASRRCYQLDHEIPVAENAQARARGDELARAQKHLLELRRTFFELHC